VPEVLAELNSDRVTYLQLPNHVTQMLAALPADPATGPALPHMRAFVVTSAVVSMAMRRAIVERLTPALHTGYGSNEAGYLTHATPADIAARPPPSGGPCPASRSRSWTTPGAAAARTIRGSVCAARRAERYVGDPETDARAYRDGWFHLGDTGRLDADGYLYLAGRLDDRINFGGRKLYPFEIEEVLLSHPDVAEAAALGLPSPVHQEVPVAAVVLRRPVPEADLIAYCAARLGAGKAPRHVVAFPELPRNAARKVPRAAIREAIRAQMQAGSGDTG
jgi:long-chain acyl-CoA synthetase